MSEEKRPAFQFYPKEWIWDLNLRECSIAARGLWADMMCLMHDGEPYGHLSASPELMLRVAGIPASIYAALVDELERKGVFSRTDAGVIYSRRMVRDEARRIAGSINGKRGGGNPSLKDPYIGTYIGGGYKGGGSRREEYISYWEKFKSLYPAHRLDEEPACRAFVAREEESAAILEGLTVAVASDDWMKDGGKYVPKASRFIRDSQYLDFKRAAADHPKVKYWKPDWEAK